MGDTDKLRLLLRAQGGWDKTSNSQISLNTFASNNAVGNLGVIFDQDTKQTGNKNVLANRDTSLKKSRPPKMFDSKLQEHHSGLQAIKTTT